MSTIEQSLIGRLRHMAGAWKSSQGFYGVGIELNEAANELESLQKACAEKDDTLRYVSEFTEHNERQGKCTICERISHALSTDCGKDYVPKSQLESANKRIAELEAEKHWFSALCIKPKEGQTLRDAILESVATEVLENENASDTPATP